jgi:hypothetical protein
VNDGIGTEPIGMGTVDASHMDAVASNEQKVLLPAGNRTDDAEENP